MLKEDIENPNAFKIGAGMNLKKLQALMGRSSLEMTRNYIPTMDEDLIQAHEAHGPIDSFI